MMGDMGFEAITFIWAFTTIRSATTHNNSIKKYKRLRLKQIYIYIYIYKIVYHFWKKFY